MQSCKDKECPCNSEEKEDDNKSVVNIEDVEVVEEPSEEEGEEINPFRRK